MNDTFTVALDLSWAEYVSVLLYMLPRIKMIRVLFAFVTILGVLTSLAGRLALGKNEKFSLLKMIWSLIGPPVTLMLTLSLLTLLLATLIIWFKPQLVRGVTYRFSPNGIEKISANQTVVIPWREFHGIKQTRSFFLLHVKKDKVDDFLVIQKRMFASREDASAFQLLMERNSSL